MNVSSVRSESEVERFVAAPAIWAGGDDPAPAGTSGGQLQMAIGYTGNRVDFARTDMDPDADQSRRDGGPEVPALVEPDPPRPLGPCRGCGQARNHGHPGESRERHPPAGSLRPDRARQQ